MATAPIHPLAWEPPYAAGAAPENGKKTKKKKTNLNDLQWEYLIFLEEAIHLAHGFSHSWHTANPVGEAQDYAN